MESILFLLIHVTTAYFTESNETFSQRVCPQVDERITVKFGLPFGLTMEDCF